MDITADNARHLLKETACRKEKPFLYDWKNIIERKNSKFAVVLCAFACFFICLAAAENTAAESDKVISYRPGDLNDDQVMRTDDAWLCLREAVGWKY